MRHSIRRVTALAAVALIVAAGGLLAPSMASAVAAPPVPDAEGTAFYNGDGVSFELDWTDPGPSHIDGYTLAGYQGKLLSGANFTVDEGNFSTDTKGDGSYLFNDLVIGKQYQGAVRAVWSVDGTGTDYSDWSYSSISSALYPAPKPVAVSAKATGVGTITVAWKAPTIPANTEGIAGYGVVASPTVDFNDIFSDDYQSDSSSKSTDSDGRSVKLVGLHPGVTYDVNVYSLGDGDGFSIGSASAYASVTVIGVPAKPTKLKVTSTGAHSSKLSWTGAKATKAGPVTGYRVYVNGKLKKTLGKSGRSYTATGQKAGKTYKYTVKAYNSVGSSPAASISKKRPKS